jgi:cell division protein FtsB
MSNKTKKRCFIVAFFLLIICLSLLLTVGKGGKYLKLREQNSTLSVEVEDLKRQNIELKNELEKLKTDQKYFEEVARREYGLLKKNEMVFDFNKKKSAEK